MAFTKKDILLLETMFTTQFALQDARIKVAMDQQRIDIVREIRDEMDARFKASEQKMIRIIDQRVSGSEQRLTNEIRGITHPLVNYFPERFEAIETNIVQIKAHVGMEK